MNEIRLKYTLALCSEHIVHLPMAISKLFSFNRYRHPTKPKINNKDTPFSAIVSLQRKFQARLGWERRLQAIAEKVLPNNRRTDLSIGKKLCPAEMMFCHVEIMFCLAPSLLGQQTLRCVAPAALHRRNSNQNKLHVH